MNDYMPSTNVIAKVYATYVGGYREGPAAFDRWLNQVKAEAWDEGYSSAEYNEHEHRPGRKIDNPYREQE